MGTVRAERQWCGPRDGAESEIAVEMRKERTATRRFPFQIVTEQYGINVQKNKITLTGKMFGGGFNRL